MESNLRQKPRARTVFQAGVNTWSKPIVSDKDYNDHESRDEVVGILMYTTKLPVACEKIIS